MSSGLLSGAVTPSTAFAEDDNSRRLVPQLSAENLTTNRPLVDLLTRTASAKRAIQAQNSLAWMLAA